MTAASGNALDVAQRYYEAWTSKDMDAAMELVADDIVWRAHPPAASTAPPSSARSWSPSPESCWRQTFLAAFGDESKAP